MGRFRVSFTASGVPISRRSINPFSPDAVFNSTAILHAFQARMYPAIAATAIKSVPAAINYTESQVVIPYSRLR